MHTLCPNAAPTVLITGERWVHTLTGSLYLSGCGCKMRGAAPLVSIITSAAAALPPPPRESNGFSAHYFYNVWCTSVRRASSWERRASLSRRPRRRPSTIQQAAHQKVAPTLAAVVTAVLETTILERRSPARGDPCNLFLSAWDAQNKQTTTRTWGNRRTKGVHT
jgi:hypothetical protein